LGVTGANISLITSLGPESGIKKFMADGADVGATPKGFGSFLQDQLATWDETGEGDRADTVRKSSGMREAIRDRLKGLKQLT